MQTLQRLLFDRLDPHRYDRGTARDLSLVCIGAASSTLGRGVMTFTSVLATAVRSVP
jgi:hypothetical protein